MLHTGFSMNGTMPTAKDDLTRIEESVDWSALIGKALADPPDPSELFHRLSQWGIVFSVVHKRNPLPGEFPEGIDLFLRSLAFANIPPEVKTWVDEFEKKHNRKASVSDLPVAMRKLLPTSDKPKGRPRCDTQLMRNAAKAWEKESLMASYETRRETISHLGKTGAVETCFGFDQVSMAGDRPSTLALEKLAEESGKSENYLLDLLFPRRKK